MQEELLKKLDMDYTLSLLKDMIRINSIVGNEGELAEFLRNELEALGMKCIIDEVEPSRPNIYSKLIGEKSGKKIHFNGHTDTIPVVHGWETDPFDPVIKNGKLFGLGVCDMKTGIACTINMLRAFIESGYSFSGELSFSGVIDEEAFGKGAKALLTSDYGKVDAIVLGEPYSGDELKPIPLGITGKILYEIIVKGKAAHAFRPQYGINAVEELGKILANLDRLNFLEHPDFGKGNYSTLKIEGGYDIYSVVVPDLARMEVNRLLVPGETVESAIKDINKLIQSLNLLADVTINIIPPRYEAYVNDRKDPIFQVFDSVYRTVMGKAPLYEYTSGITDANIFTGEGNIPCLHLGPHQEVAHQKNEYIPLNCLEPLSKMYTLIAAKFLT
ncbi:MAG: M20 family metallopeptidase [Candidatus Hodarchaeales archaeon]|jgi:acetylornithine deacetylase/succinyl-diaminopimelate desuccinylase family protein